MCMGGSTPSAAPATPLPPPAPVASGSSAVLAAGAQQRQTASMAMGPMSMIQNIGGAQGLVAPANTTQKSQLGG